MPHLDNLNHRLRTNKALTWKLNLRWVIGLALATSLFGVSEAWALQVSPTQLSFTAVQGGTNPPNQTLTFRRENSSFVKRSWSITDNASWVSVSPASGTFSTETEQVVVGVNPSGLAAGSFQATVTITVIGRKGGTSNTSVPIALTLTAVSVLPTIRLSPTNLTFAGVRGGANPSAQSVSVSNKGGGSLSWSASDNATWLTLSPASGTTTTETDAVTASVNLAGLIAGTYNATITATASGATNTPQTVPVTLTVTAPPTSGTATLTWNASTSTDLASYNVYIGTSSGVYGPPRSVGKVTTYQVINLQKGTTYFFAITAVDTAGNQSDYSNEVSKSIY